MSNELVFGTELKVNGILDGNGNGIVPKWQYGTELSDSNGIENGKGICHFFIAGINGWKETLMESLIETETGRAVTASNGRNDTNGIVNRDGNGTSRDRN